MALVARENITAAALPGARLPADWRISIRSQHCQPRNTLRFELDDVRTAVIMALHYNATNGSPGLFVDIGSNCGVYSLIMASLGHRCVATDPLPTCVADMRASAIENGLGPPRIDAFQGGVSDAAFNFSVPTHQCSPYFIVGSSSETRRRAGLWNAKDSAQTALAKAVPLHRLLQAAGEAQRERIMMLKIDTEGHEVRVLSSARHLIERRAVHAVLWELTPAKWARAGVSLADGVAVLRSLFSAPRYHSYFSSRPAFCDHHRAHPTCRLVSSPIALPRGLDPRTAVYIPNVGTLADAMHRSNWSAAENIFSVAS